MKQQIKQLSSKDAAEDKAVEAKRSGLQKQKRYKLIRQQLNPKMEVVDEVAGENMRSF